MAGLLKTWNINEKTKYKREGHGHKYNEKLRKLCIYVQVLSCMNLWIMSIQRFSKEALFVLYLHSVLNFAECEENVNWKFTAKIKVIVLSSAKFNCLSTNIINGQYQASWETKHFFVNLPCHTPVVCCFLHVFGLCTRSCVPLVSNIIYSQLVCNPIT